MSRFPFSIKKMRWIWIFIGINTVLFVISQGDARNWEATVFSSLPVSLVLTSYLHFGLRHFLSNMYVTYIFGGLLCQNMSDKKANGFTLPILFLVASIVTGIVPYYLQPHTFTAGASGTVYALEAYVFVMAFAGGKDPMSLGLRQQTRWLIINAVIAVIWSFNPNVSLIGHLSGAVVGAIIAFADLQWRRHIKKQNDNKRTTDYVPEL